MLCKGYGTFEREVTGVAPVLSKSLHRIWHSQVGLTTSPGFLLQPCMAGGMEHSFFLQSLENYSATTLFWPPPTKQVEIVDILLIQGVTGV